MACGNNKVSRAALHTSPTPASPPAVPAPRAIDRVAVQERAARANSEIAAASADVCRSNSRVDVDRALAKAQDALRAARRAGLSRETLRALEREVAGIEKDARQALGRIDADQANERVAVEFASRDRLSPWSLGVPAIRVNAPAGRSEDLTRRDPQRKPPARGDSKARSGSRGRQGQSDSAATKAAIKAINRSENLSLDELAQAKKDAQRALNSLRRQPNPPEAEVQRLADAVKSLQRAEAKKRKADGASDRGLTSAERGALASYTGAGYSDLNLALREGTLDAIAQIAARSSVLSAALQRLPAHSGTVVRGAGAQLDKTAIDRYEPGETIVENHYLSTAADPDHEFGGNVVWIVESKRGRDISDHSRYEESEVLFDRFTRFEVLAKDFDEALGRWVIYMQEL